MFNVIIPVILVSVTFIYIVVFACNARNKKVYPIK